MKEDRKGYTIILGYVSLLLAYFMVQILRNSPSAIKPMLDAEFGLTTLQYSNLSAAFFYSYALVQIPAGILNDVTGPKKTALGGVGLMAAGSLLQAVSRGYAMLFGSRLIMGLGSGVIFLCVLKYLALYFPEERFSTMTGISSGVANTAAVLSQAPVVALAAVLSWRGCYTLFGGIVFLALVLILMTLPARRAQTAAAAPAPELSGILRGIRRILSNRHMYAPLLITFIAQGIYVVGFTWTISYLGDVYGMTPVQAGTVSSMIPVTAVVVTVAAGRLCDVIRRRNPVGILCSLAIALLLAFAAFAGEEKPPLVLGCAAMMSSGVAVFYAIYFGLGKDLNPPELSGLATGIVNMATFLGASVFPLIFGAVLNGAGRTAAGYRLAYRILFILSLLLVVLCARARETGMKNRWEEIREGKF